MAPYPEEVDVFSEPHSRMKRLVEVYSEKLSSTDFLNDEALESFLHSLQQTFCEFKTHEQIENKLIMKKLKNKLKALSIHDAAVCNCHNDTRLVDMLALVHDGYSCTGKPNTDRQNYALKLENALNEFTQDFIPHMQEEEEVFQPLLIKYFEYEELKLLKERVLEEHTRWQQGNPILDEVTEKAERELHTLSDKKHDVSKESSSLLLSLPPELVSQIFSFLSPIDLVRCSGVNRHWNQLAYDPSLWKHIDPIQWAAGKWEWQNADAETLSPSTSCPCDDFPADEDADMDDLLTYTSDSQETDCSSNCQGQERSRQRKVLTGVAHFLLPQVGTGVLTLKLPKSTVLTSRMLLNMLKHCPNLYYLDVSYTHITDTAFKGLKEYNTCQNLEHLDLSGCEELTDLGLERLATWFYSPTNQRTVCSQVLQPWRVQPWDCNVVYKCPYSIRPCKYATLQSSNSCHLLKPVRSSLRFLSLSGCYQVTDDGLRLLSELGILSKIEHLDVSGCWQLSGPCLQQAVSLAPQLSPQGLFYCNNILDGPYQDLANGCENLECNFRACCCNGD